jgi:hypothetical protein
MSVVLYFVAVMAFNSIALSIAPQAASAPAQECKLRFDGIYEMQGREYLAYRFFPNGTVADEFGDRAGAVASLSRRRPGLGQFGKYRVEGCTLRVETSFMGGEPDTFRVGTIEGERLKMELQAKPGTHPARPEEFVFYPVDFPAARQQAVAERRQAAAQQAAAIQLRLGSATMDSGCTQVRFDPAPAPATLDYGAKAVAVELTGGFPTVRLTGGAICSPAGLSMRTCNQYGIVMGRPEIYAQTTIVSCKDKQPFRRGKYAVTAGAKSAALVVK